jgi:DNA (cytosine-5)-methyltransferase 1
MNYISVCSGIEAATTAWHHLDWEPLAFSEIEPFPSAVLAHHWPDVPNLGDMTKHNEWTIRDTVDLLVGGTPCQSFSVAGLRKGLRDSRGGLMLTYLEIAQRFRPRWIVWENVPGVLSSNGGRDFGSFLGALVELGYGFAYRVLDAQWFGVPQRRRRVFVVGCLGDATSAAKVLFESESVRRDSPPSRKAREVAPTSPSRSTASGKFTFPCLMANAGSKLWLGNQEALTGDFHILEPRTPEGGNPLPAIAYSIRLANTSSNGWGIQEEVTHTLDCTAGPAIAFDTTQATSPSNYSNPKPGDPCQPLAAGAHSPAVATQQAVRRLTPTECERLQGFPDDHTLIPWRNKPADQCPDGPRYKALGNSMAVPVMRWIGERIHKINTLI